MSSPITSVESWREKVPLRRPYAIAGRTFDSVELFFLRLFDASGRCGLGSASPAEFVTGETIDSCAAALDPSAIGDLVGNQPAELVASRRERGSAQSSTPAAAAAVDMALWDLHARQLGRPLVELLGRRRDDLPTSVTLGISSVEETLADAEEWVGRGFRYLKVKLGQDLESDLERLTRLREKHGSDVELRVDVNQGYGVSEVERLFAAAGPLGLELIEQPLERGEGPRLLELDRPEVPIAADESLLDAQDALVQAEVDSPYRIFNIKLMKCGGVGPALAISAVAEAARRDLMWGSMDESRISIAAALHTAYACPRTRYLDLDGSFDLARDPAVGGFEVVDGVMIPSTEPGLGVQLQRSRSST